MRLRTEVLRAVYFFRDLDAPTLEAMADACGECAFDSGERIFTEHEHGDRVFVVIEGQVEVWKNHGFPDAKLFTTHGPGGVFGEMALVDNLPRSATALATAPTRALFLAREPFQQLVHVNPGIAISLMRSLSAIVRNSNESFVADLYVRNRELEDAYRRLQAAQAELLENERLSNMGKFSNMILHDIRNPVSVLQGYARLLESVAAQPERVTEYARKIHLEAERLGHLAGELLDYSRGQVRLEMSIVEPRRLVEHALGYLTEKLESRRIGVDVMVDSNQPVILDWDRMTRVLLNVIDNARAACKRDGSIRVRVSHAEGTVAFQVSDDGEGMQPEDVRRVTEPFFSRSAGGTGLGMAIVKSIVEAHGGDLGIESMPGSGTTVTVRIPARA